MKAASHFKNNKTLIAFDVYNELADEYNLLHLDDKIMIANWVKDWYFACKNSSPNHLVTVGMMHPHMTIVTDPLLFHVDFVNYHLYYKDSSAMVNKNGLANDLYWINRTNENLTWTLGEASFSGHKTTFNNEVGTYSSQKDYADFLLQRALDCGCAGPAWWEFSDYIDGGPYRGSNGIVTLYNTSLITSENSKPASKSFQNYQYLLQDKTKCQKDSNYFNKYGLNHLILICKGYVQDNYGNAIENATIEANCAGNVFRTYSNQYGFYEINAPINYDTIQELRISAGGYELYIDFKVPANGATHRHSPVLLDKLVNNSWQNMWRNRESGRIEYRNFWRSPINDTTDHYFNSSGKFLKIDIDGDNEDEVLLIDKTIFGNVKIVLFDYYKGSLRGIWDNSNGSTLDQYFNVFANTPQITKKILIGNFDGQNGEEILFYTDFNQKVRLFNFDGTGWNILNTSNYAATNTMMDYRSSFHVGDFNGDGKDEILGNDISQLNGWMTLFEYNQNTSQWQWGNFSSGASNHPLFQYRQDLYVGDFDGDGKDEIFGRNLTSLEIFDYSEQFGVGFFTRNWYKNDPSHYVLPYNKLIVGNFDSDPNDELFAYGGWATKFDFEDGDFQWNWSTFSDTRIVEYPIFPVQTDHQLFFYKPYKHVPAYLFVNDGSKINLFSMNTRIMDDQSLIKGKRDLNENTHKDDVVLDDNDDLNSIIIHPNPTRNIVNYEILRGEFQYLRIYDSNGKILAKKELNVALGIVEIGEYSNGLYFFMFTGREKSIIKKVLLNH